ncbi:metallophosphoesterase [Acetobacterium tundrae]|uniref:Metallophosphoesterase n=1 Tax=Acetobacterium tundrae TaxID=132932 RepID=A0ABR6WHT7_9FIRM|nr:metallophosphoesterase [Acetobacterium tundrae]
MILNEKKKLLLIVGIVVLVTLALMLWSPKQPGIMTVKPNIATTEDPNNPTLNDTVTTISLTFTEKIDPTTIADAVKLYRIDGNGNAVEEPSVIKMDAADPTVVDINNKAMTALTQGEEYQISISRDLKAKSGSSLAGDFAGYFATNYQLNLAGNKDLNNERTQIVVISDIHLGIDDRYTETLANRQPLVDYLNQVKASPNVKELVIAGDFLDFWMLPMDYMMPDSQSAFYDAVAANNQTVVDAINAIIQSGEIKVTYIPGNHDLLATDADIARIFPGINQARDSMQGLGSYVTGTNSEIVIEHGHRYDLYSAPDPISNREITQNGTSILPPAYFYARIGSSAVAEGYPKTTNTFPDLKVDKNDANQLNIYRYAQVWKALLSAIPIKESYADPVIKTNVDGYTQTYAVDDLLPHQNDDGTLAMNLYKDIQNTWDERQTINGVKVNIPVADAVAKSADSAFIDSQAQAQIFDTDPTKRIVVFGHTHHARIAPMTNPAGQKTIYANSGTWIDHAPRNPSMTFVVISPQKADSAIEIVNLYQYAKDQTITQWANGQAITNP